MKVVRFDESTNLGLHLTNKQPTRRVGKRQRRNKKISVLEGLPKAESVYKIMIDANHHESIKGICKNFPKTRMLVQPLLGELTRTNNGNLESGLQSISRSPRDFVMLPDTAIHWLAYLAVDENFKTLLPDDGGSSLGSDLVTVQSQEDFEKSSNKVVTLVLVKATFNTAQKEMAERGNFTLPDFKHECCKLFKTNTENFSYAFERVTGLGFSTLQPANQAPEPANQASIYQTITTFVDSLVDAGAQVCNTLPDANTIDIHSQKSISVVLEGAVVTAMQKWALIAGISVPRMLELYSAICTEKLAGRSRAPQQERERASRQSRFSFPELPSPMWFAAGVVATLALTRGKGGKGN